MDSSDNLNNSKLGNPDDLSLRSPSPFLQLSRADSRSSMHDSSGFLNMTTIYHQVEIRQRDSFKFFVRADEPLETLHFSFYTRKKSIGFGLFYLYLQNLSTESTNEQVSLPLEKVKELIGASRQNIKMQKMGQEGTLGRALSSNNKNSKAKSAIHSSKSASTESLSLMEDSPQLSNSNMAQLRNSQKMKIGELIEVVPIKKYQVCDYTMEGSYTIPLTGTYVLLFDNSFSLGTSKHLFYHAYLSTDIVPSPSATPQLLSSGQVGSLCAAGWISKKRFGVVRSWSRRWFQLDSLGVLSYFEDRASPLRGSIFVPDCSLIIAKRTLKFSLDSGNQIFHLQAYRKEEFDFWIQVLSSFKHFGPPTTIKSSHQLPTKLSAPSPPSLRSKISEAFRTVRLRLDTLKAEEKETTADAREANISETILNLESIYSLLQRTRETLDEVEEGGEAEEYADAHGGAEEYDEVFYDVEEIYVDDIEDDHITAASTGATTDDGDEVFEPVLEHDHDHHQITAKKEQPRTVTDWLLKAEISLQIDAEAASGLYRTNMPFPAPPINISFASVIMKKSFPVALNEPINLLQRLAEELEYSELLDRAASLKDDPIEQLVYVTAFAVSGYASSSHRSERKPYNPVLGETFEYIRPDRGFRFVSEKVSHQPVIVACHAESKRWRFWQDLQAETKLWGKSMLIIPKGKVHLELLDEETGQVQSAFVWGKVSGALRNVYSSKKSIENYGQLVIKNRQADLESRITFEEGGMFSSSGNEVSGGIYKNSESCALINLTGRWDDMLCKEIRVCSKGGSSCNDNKFDSKNNNNPHCNTGTDNLLQVIWRTNPLPSNFAQFFHLTYFAVTLNDFPDLLRKVLPLTDSRYRPDQRMLESGMIDAADLEKQRIEQVQRDRRNSNDPIVPLWFSFDSTSKSWKFNQKYWDARENNFNNFKLPKLW